MNTNLPVPAPRAGAHTPAAPLRLSLPVCGLLALALSLGLTGCFGFLKPAKPTARQFVLAPLPAAKPDAGSSGSVAVGVGPVKLAGYLFGSGMAVRKGANEIEFLPSTFWAERLDAGLQRVLAANLASLLPTDQVRVSAWQTSDVSVEVYIAVEQFEVDARGQAVMNAWWRVVSPGGDKTLKSGQFRGTRKGPDPEADPSGTVAALSDLVADLSRQVATAIKESQPR